MVKNAPAMQETCVWSPGEGNGNWLQYYCLENSMDRGAWWATVHGCQEQKLRPWQRSWGRRLGIRKGGIEPQESPWKFLSIYPQNQSLPTFCFVFSPTPLILCPPLPLSENRVNLYLQLIIPGCDSVLTYKLLWKSSSLSE